MTSVNEKKQRIILNLDLDVEVKEKSNTPKYARGDIIRDLQTGTFITVKVVKVPGSP